MKAKQVYLTGKEQIIIETMISMEIRSNDNCMEWGIEPAFNTKMLKALYRKITGFEWKEEEEN